MRGRILHPADRIVTLYGGHRPRAAIGTSRPNHMSVVSRQLLRQEPTWGGIAVPRQDAPVFVFPLIFGRVV
jgi:hypothetical protein